MKSIILLLLMAAVLAGCQSTSKYHFETRKPDGSFTTANAELEPKDLSGGVLFIYDADGSLRLQAGDIKTAEDPYAEVIQGIVEEAIPAALCANNPLLCTK